MNLQSARRIAKYIVMNMVGATVGDSCRIVGSIRREKPEVKDIEIIALPLYRTDPTGDTLFAGERLTNTLHEWAMSERTRRVIRWVKCGRGTLEKGGLEDCDPMPEGRYWRGVVAVPSMQDATVPPTIMLDLFLPTTEGYGCQELIRTGSAEFSQAVVTHALRRGKKFKDGVLREGYDGSGPVIQCPREGDVFDALGLEWIEPKDRIDKTSLRVRPTR